jgi:opacity protein-like surface antigen
MKKSALISVIILLPFLLHAQFEQKMSFNISAGGFKTVGKKTYVPQWASDPSDYEPSQMVNYKPGYYLQAALQLNLNRHFSIQADVGYAHSPSWYYATDDVSYLAYNIYDSLDENIVLAQGEDELNLTNVSIGLTPKYYLSPGEKLNPYVFLGVNMNLTSCEYRSNEWYDARDVGYLDPDDLVPWNDYLENSSAFGIRPGFGADYQLSERIGLFATGGYQFIAIDKKRFKSSEQEENLHFLYLQVGVRLSFMKSKQL